MDFDVVTSTGSADQYRGEDANFAIKDSGALEAWDSRRRVVYSSVGWLRVEVEPEESSYDVVESVL